MSSRKMAGTRKFDELRRSPRISAHQSCREANERGRPGSRSVSAIELRWSKIVQVSGETVWNGVIRCNQEV